MSKKKYWPDIKRSGCEPNGIMPLNVQMSCGSEEVSCLSLFQMLSNPQSYLITTGWTDNVLWNWFTVVFLDFTNLKANFLHYRNEYITGFTYHLHLAKLLRKEHHATFRCKPLTSFLFSWGCYRLFGSLSHMTGELLLYSPLLCQSSAWYFRTVA